MSVAFETSHVTVHQGDALTVLRSMPSESIDCCVTSPPYWGLRDYGTATWDGGSAECDHRQESPSDVKYRYDTGGSKGLSSWSTRDVTVKAGAARRKCGARRIDSQIGLEATPQEYVEKMVAVFREVRRVLAKQGTLWLNMGDSYTSGGRDYRDPGKSEMNGGGRVAGLTAKGPRALTPDGLKPKDLVGIPWRVAFALQADGWYLRSDIIWAKPNPMPESVTDRPTKAHEYVFLLTKSPRYYYDAEAIREPFESSDSDLRKMANGAERIGGKHKLLDDDMVAASAHTNVGRKRAVGNAQAAAATLAARHFPGIGAQHVAARDGVGRRGPEDSQPMLNINGGRNVRSVWTIATQPYPSAHFATFPRELAERCIKAGCPERVCSTCGKARERTTSATYTNPGNRRSNGRRDGEGFRETGVRVMASGKRLEKQVTTTGFTDCGHDAYVPGVVLDPFAGSGTTLAVARDLGRKSIGIELNPEYVRLIERRCAQLAMEMGA